MKELSVTVGLYRHFKGQYYYVTDLSKSATDEETIMVNYFNVCYPEYGSCVRPLESFVATHEEDGRAIKDREDNVTGQSIRFERVKDLNFQLGSIPTEQIIEELSKRKDSPLHELDIEGLKNDIFVKDYCVGDKYEETDTTPRGVYTLSTFNTLEEAQRYYSNHKHRESTKIFKRVFIEEEF